MSFYQHQTCMLTDKYLHIVVLYLNLIYIH